MHDKDSQAPYYTALAGILDVQGMQGVADRVFAQTFRRDFNAPGAALISLGPAVDSFELRRFMVSLKAMLGQRWHELTGKRLVYMSLGRFDQQDTTKFHLDGAPDESFLMLGYEPSAVTSEVAIADYSKAAFDLGIEPKQFLAEFNPMYADGQRRLAPYVTKLSAFNPADAQLLLVNNSSLPFHHDGGNQLGVMHQATILNPDTGLRRIVNSTMLTTSHDSSGEAASESAVRTFLETKTISKKVYG